MRDGGGGRREKKRREKKRKKSRHSLHGYGFSKFHLNVELVTKQYDNAKQGMFISTYLKVSLQNVVTPAW